MKRVVDIKESGDYVVKETCCFVWGMGEAVCKAEVDTEYAGAFSRCLESITGQKAVLLNGTP